MSASLPTFLIIGAQKAATRWMRDNLNSHPDVHVATRELEFFNLNWRRGLDWYRAQIGDPGSASAIGEVTPGYMMWTDKPRESAARIDGALPGVRLIAILRHPLDRMISAFIHHARMGRIPSTRTLADHVAEVAPDRDPLGLVAGGWYGASLTPYFQRFGDRLLIVPHELVASEPNDAYQRALEHIGVEPAPHVHPDLERVLHTNRQSVERWVLDSARLDDTQRASLWEQCFEKDLTLLRQFMGQGFPSWGPEIPGHLVR